MELLNSNFSKVKQKGKLHKAFQTLHGKLRILPDDAMVAFSLDTDDVKTRISLKKLIEWFKIYYAADLKKANVESEEIVQHIMRHFYFKGKCENTCL